jgi:hypothetical protein
MLLIDPKGSVRCLYTEAIDLTCLGLSSIARASHVEPDEDGRWWADLAPMQGPKLGPYRLRSAALDAEQKWLEASLAGASQLARS